MKGNTIILIGYSPRLSELLKNEWKNVVDEGKVFIGQLGELPPMKEVEMTCIFDELASLPRMVSKIPPTKRKPLPYYHGKRRW